MANQDTNQKHRKTLKGEVVKVIDDFTVKVEVERKQPHPLYKKIIKSHKTYLVDASNNEVNVGDYVTIEECKPKSKSKTFKLIEVNNN